MCRRVWAPVWEAVGPASVSNGGAEDVRGRSPAPAPQSVEAH